MGSANWMKAGVLFGVGVLLLGCATAKDVQILNNEIYKLELQIYSVQKEKDALRNEFMAFQKEARNDISTLKKELALSQKESKISISTFQRELDRLRADLTLENKNLQTDLVIRLETLQSQLNRVQKEKESFRNEFMAFQKEARNDISALKKEDHVLKRDLAAESKRSRADFSLRLDALQSEIRTVSTGVEEYKEFLKKPSREMDLLREDVATRMKVLEEKNWVQEDRMRALEERLKGIEDQYKALDGKIGTMASKQAEFEKSLPTKGARPEIGASLIVAGTLYKDAYETYQKGDVEKARSKFEMFLKQYPDIGLSGNAQFWIGETYYQKRDFERAILEYEKVIAKHPESEKVPAALFKQGLAFLELGDKRNARNLLKRVIERYPQFEQVETAKKKLESIQ